MTDKIVARSMGEQLIEVARYENGEMTWNLTDECVTFIENHYIEKGRQMIIEEIEQQAGETLFLLEDLKFWQALKGDK